jgi:hypothetical protein
MKAKARAPRQLLLALLSAIAPCIALPPPSVESYLLHPCSRRQLFLRCSTSYILVGNDINVFGKVCEILRGSVA